MSPISKKRMPMLSSIILRLYRFENDKLRGRLRYLATRLEGGEMRSDTLRLIFSKYYSVEIGKYTHGYCYELHMVDPKTKIGRYCSFAKGMRILNHNHPIDFKSTSPIFVHPVFGHCKEWLVKFNPLEIGNDVWVGANAVILPEVSKIGDGAVIGAGAVVTKDVPPYAVVLGNPARVVKYRFSEDRIKELLAERWWDRDIDELASDIKAFQAPLEGGSIENA
jgi:virginiamycin A acetyltransferase